MIQGSRELLPVPLPASWADATADEVTVSVTTDDEPGAFFAVESLAGGVAQMNVGPGSQRGELSTNLNRVFAQRGAEIKWCMSVWVEGGTSSDPDDIDGGGASSGDFSSDIDGGTA